MVRLDREGRNQGSGAERGPAGISGFLALVSFVRRSLAEWFIAFLAVGLMASPAAAFPDELPLARALPFGSGLSIGDGPIAARGGDLAQMLVPSPRIERLVAPVAGLAEDRQLSYVQSVVGQMVAWRDDRALWGADDYWATPRETLSRRAGDCEDIAILKLAALATLGFPDDRLALVVGRDRVRGDHAIAAVRLREGWRLLDDDDVVRRADAMVRFSPVYSLVAGRAFLHGEARPVRSAAGNP